MVSSKRIPVHDPTVIRVPFGFDGAPPYERESVHRSHADHGGEFGGVRMSGKDDYYNYSARSVVTTN